MNHSDETHQLIRDMIRTAEQLLKTAHALMEGTSLPPKKPAPSERASSSPASIFTQKESDSSVHVSGSVSPAAEEKPQEGRGEERERREKAPVNPPIFGQFDGEQMVCPDGSVYPVDASFITEAELVIGDKLKRTEGPQGVEYKIVEKLRRQVLTGILENRDGVWVGSTPQGNFLIPAASVQAKHLQAGMQWQFLVPKGKMEGPHAALKLILEDIPLAPRRENYSSKPAREGGYHTNRQDHGSGGGGGRDFSRDRREGGGRRWESRDQQPEPLFSPDERRAMASAAEAARVPQHVPAPTSATPPVQATPVAQPAPPVAATWDDEYELR